MPPPSYSPQVDEEEDVLPAPLQPVVRRAPPPVLPPAPQPRVGSTGGILPEQGYLAGEDVSKPRNQAVQWSGDPLERQGQVQAEVARRKEEQFQQKHPFATSFDRRPAPTHQELHQGAQQADLEFQSQRYKEIAARKQQKAQATGERKARSNEREAQFRATGQQFYTDTNQELQPVLDVRGQPLYHPTKPELTEHPKTGAPVMGWRDVKGQRQFKELPVVSSDDPLDENLYHRLPDGTLHETPAGKAADLIGSPINTVAKAARAAVMRRNNTLRKQAVQPLKTELDAAELELHSAKVQSLALDTEMKKLEAGAAADPAIGAQVQQLQLQKDAIDESLKGGTQLTLGVAGARLRHDAADLTSKRDAFIDNEQAILAGHKARGVKDPNSDPTFLSNRRDLMAVAHASDVAEKQLARYDEVMRMKATVASPPPPPEVGTIAGVVNTGIRAGRQSLAGMDVLGANARMAKRNEYLSQATTLTEQADNIDQLQPQWTPENRAAWAERARGTAAQLTERAAAMQESAGAQLEGAAGQMKKAGAIKSSPAYEGYQQAKGGDALKRFFQDPIEIATNIAAEGAMGSLPTLAAGAVGAAAGGVPGLAAGTGIGSFATEYASTLLDTFQGAGVDANDPAALAAAFSNPRIMAVAQRRGLARGIPVAVFDALSGGLAGRTVHGGVGAMVKAGAREMGEQAGLGMAGEAAGQVSEQVAETGRVSDLNIKDIVAEGIGEVVPGLGQIIGGAAMRRRGRGSVGPGAEPSAPADNAPFDPNPPPTPEAQPQGMAPEHAEEIFREQQPSPAPIPETPPAQPAAEPAGTAEAAAENAAVAAPASNLSATPAPTSENQPASNNELTPNLPVAQDTGQQGPARTDTGGAEATQAEASPLTPDLHDKKVTLEFRRAKTGEAVQVEMPAKKAEERVQKHLTTLQRIRRCLDGHWV